MKAIILESTHHPLVKHLVKLRDNARYRNEHGSVLIEGANLVTEITAKVPAKVIMATPQHCTDQYRTEALFSINEAILKKVTGTVSPEGIVAEVAMAKPASFEGVRRILALDRIQDPGNMGTLLRTALALGWDAAFILEGCCDPYNDKALRAAKGATFRLPWKKGSWEELKAVGRKNSMSFFAADLNGEPFDNESLSAEAIVLVLGNEAQGLSEEALRSCQKITISMSGDMESLNVSVAGGILMYFLKGNK